jgi:saccharopine dehydrogenase-like NADP-dependent oxidoreductase
VDQSDVLEQLVESHDLVVSLLPYEHHVRIAESCLIHHKDMITTSYVSPEMQALDGRAKQAGIIILNEIGVDPGYDHMTAMEIIDRVHSAGGKVDAFYSLCGALCAPEVADNPFRYKFSWSPRGVVMAGNNGAQYLKNGEVIQVDAVDLFLDPMEIDFPGVERLHVYPNRDSLPYINLYGIPGVKTMYRGTFRYANWCAAMHLLKALRLTRYEPMDLRGKTYAQVTADLNEMNDLTLREDIKARYGIADDHPGLKAVAWLGVLDPEPVRLREGSSLDLTTDLMIEKMMMDDTERDMVIMQHIFDVTKSDRSRERITARMLDYGNRNYTSIARTVALPAAIAARLILEGRISDKGVQIPVTRSIYRPVLDELKKLGISMNETVEEIVLE